MQNIKKWASASLKETLTPNTDRWPSMVTPVATSTAQLTTLPPCRTFS
jgi:hypothetical protein